MRKKINDFYLKRSTFLFFAITAMLGWLAWSITTYVTNNPIKLTIFGVIFFALTCGMTLSYLKGETNIQKMLFGSLLVFFIIDYVEIVEIYITYHLISSAIVMGISLATFIVFFVCHAMQQQDHIGNSIIIVINQCCGIIIFMSIVYLTINLVSATVTLADYTFCAAIMLTMGLVICMETRISKYKQIRAMHKASGNWDEAARIEAKKLFKL